MSRIAIFGALIAGMLLSACASAPGLAQVRDSELDSKAAQPMPRLVGESGRFVFLVDDKPFLVLAGQANNSSNYPDMLAEVWPAMRDLGANTLQIPVAWEQVEPVEGQFDFSWVETLLDEARANDMRLILLWYGTWKNTSPHYAPAWVKLDNDRFPRMVGPDGETHYALSPNQRSTFEADQRAFVALMQFLKANDPDRIVIMVQVQNETGSYRQVRDYSDTAEAEFKSAVPDALVHALAVSPGTWTEVFGTDADEYFQAWSIARYVGEMATAGRAVYDLPMYANAALRDPVAPQEPGAYASGGPAFNVIDIWQAAAPSLDFLAPDIYFREHDRYARVLDQYGLPDNALFVPETGNDEDYARFFFMTLGQGAIGFSPFGMDYTGYGNYPLGGKPMTPDLIAPFADNYRLVAPFGEEWARLAYESEVWGVAKPDDASSQTLDLGGWTADIDYKEWQFGFSDWDFLGDYERKDGTENPNAGVLLARLAPDTFLVTGYHARVSFGLGNGREDEHLIFDRVEEVEWTGDRWRVRRVWNGDQTDYGLNFTDRRQVLRVKLATYE